MPKIESSACSPWGLPPHPTIRVSCILSTGRPWTARSPCTGLFPRPAVRGSARGCRGRWLQQSVSSELPGHGRLFPGPQAPASSSLRNSSTSDFPSHFPLCKSLACDVQKSGLSFGFAPNTKFSLSLFFIWLVYSILHFLFLKLLSFFVVFCFPPSSLGSSGAEFIPPGSLPESATPTFSSFLCL